MLETAMAFGATAVYAGQPRYSLRVRNNDFGNIEVLKTGVDRAHALGNKFYLVSNIFPHDHKIKSYVQNMAPVIALKPDAMIMSDPGLIMMVRETWPRSSCLGSCPWTRWRRFARSAPTPSWRCLCTGHCALPVRAAACCRAISTTETPIRAVAPIVGDRLSYDAARGLAEVNVRNRFAVGAWQRSCCGCSCLRVR